MAGALAFGIAGAIGIEITIAFATAATTLKAIVTQIGQQIA